MASPAGRRSPTTNLDARVTSRPEAPVLETTGPVTAVDAPAGWSRSPRGPAAPPSLPARDALRLNDAQGRGGRRAEAAFPSRCRCRRPPRPWPQAGVPQAVIACNRPAISLAAELVAALAPALWRAINLVMSPSTLMRPP